VIWRRLVAEMKASAYVMAIAAACAFGQQSGVAPRFEVVSVKPSGPETKGAGIRALPGGRFEARNAPLIALLVRAFGVTEFQIEGTPGWAADARFDIDATAGAGEISAAHLDLMVQALLADRFGLRVHHETRAMPVYALLPGKNGVRLKVVSDGGPPAFDYALYGGHLSGISVRMTDFVRVVQRWLDRPVVDKTGFMEAFNVALSWAPGPENIHNSVPFTPSSDDPRPSLFTALQDQLGLRLNAERDSLDVIVVDRVERPSLN
jgi:uncharacterized protein (TIGR03435 family)